MNSPDSARRRADPVLVNGQETAWRPDRTIAGLLEERGAGGPGVAVERNGRVVPRDRHEDVAVEPGDRIEIVRLVGGG